MSDQRMVSFTIASMDSLGQGVSKETDKITFIPKTLPGEQGDAQVVASKKGVQFAQLKTLKKVSPQRVEPVCPHFKFCPSCHYLHTNYEEELKFKEQNLEKMFQKIPHPAIQVTPAIRRTNYRNRIQLHYDVRARRLGMLDAKNHTIAPIPQCLIGRDSITAEIKRLYEKDQWLNLLGQQHPPKGHVEIYEMNGEVKVSINQPYAEGGFTQVFDEMNQLMKNMLNVWSEQLPNGDLLDLFAGNGNLSEKMNHSRRLCVDVYNKKVENPFLSQDLYDLNALKIVKKKVLENGLKPALLVVDPPRSGLKNLDQWLAEFSPEKVAYVSCDPHTLVRDLLPLKNYQVTELHLIDFFPSTFHFETVAFLERK